MREMFNDVVDELGVLEETLEKLSVRQKELRDLLAFSLYPEIEGMQFRAKIAHGTQSHLDMSKIKLVLEGKTLKECIKTTKVLDIHIERL